MSINLGIRATINCDALGCGVFFQENSVCTPRETRASARAGGWEVGLPAHPGDRWQRDYCPEHRSEVTPAMERAMATPDRLCLATITTPDGARVFACGQVRKRGRAHLTHRQERNQSEGRPSAIWKTEDRYVEANPRGWGWQYLGQSLT